jgi:alkanesulfonate monooxygenase SsuD/methylene tetrahydromethanopterin reductase-like flavin-dependent oxidoreductase (luciferase family)
MSEIYKAMLQARENAAIVSRWHTTPGKTKASLTLYKVLAECKQLCERCETSPQDKAEVDRMFAEQPKAGNRRYVEKGSDVYVLICRFVFAETDRTNAMRYAAALREAAKMDIPGARLSDWMKTNGGINALYFRRPLDAREVKTKALRLDQQITISRDKPFVLTLQWQPDNTFTVIGQEIAA